MGYNKKYVEKLFDDPLTPLAEDERIYLNVPYNARYFAKYSNCGFDGEKKLWFTGLNNTYISELIKLYGVNEATSKKTKQLLKEKNMG